MREYEFMARPYIEHSTGFLLNIGNKSPERVFVMDINEHTYEEGFTCIGSFQVNKDETAVLRDKDCYKHIFRKGLYTIYLNEDKRRAVLVRINILL